MKPAVTRPSGAIDEEYRGSRCSGSASEGFGEAQAVSLATCILMAGGASQAGTLTMGIGPNTIERMRAYERATGLKPVGRHRPAADKLLKGVSQRCMHCGGQGYVEVRSAWIWCEVCGGLGRVMTPKAQLLLRGRVEEKFPGAGVQAPTLVLA